MTHILRTKIWYIATVEVILWLLIYSVQQITDEQLPTMWKAKNILFVYKNQRYEITCLIE